MASQVSMSLVRRQAVLEPLDINESDDDEVDSPVGSPRNNANGNPAGINGAQAGACNAQSVKDTSKLIANLVVDCAAEGVKATAKGTALSVVAGPMQAVRPLANACGAAPRMNACEAVVRSAVTNTVDSAVNATGNVAKAAIGAGIDAVVDRCAQPNSCASRVGSRLGC